MNDSVIEYILSVVLFLSVLYLQRDTLRFLYVRIYKVQKIRKKLSAIWLDRDMYQYRGVRRELFHLIRLTGSENIYPTPNTLIYFSIVLAMACIFIMLYSQGVVFSIILGILAGSIPWLHLAVRVKHMRVKLSKEGKLLIGEIMNQYLICSGDIISAMEKTSLNKSISHQLRNVLITLAGELRQASNDIQIEKRTRLLHKAIGTSWANLLALLIRISLVKKKNIYPSLKNLWDYVVNQTQMIEFSKREGFQSKVIIRYITPIAYIITLAAGKYYLDMDFKSLFHLQFHTDLGIRWFALCIIALTMGILADEFLKEEKIDV